MTKGVRPNQINMCGSGYPTVLSLYPRPIQISGTFPSPIPVLVLVSTMAASLKEAGPTCSVLSLTFNKCDHIKETKSIIVPAINSRTFNDIFDEHHDFVRQFNFTCESGLQGEDEVYRLHDACRAWLIVHAVMHQFFSFFHVRCQKVTELQYHSPCLYVTKQCSFSYLLAVNNKV